jgi:hypothetical protein
MRAKNLFIHILAVLISLPLIGTVAQTATIEVLETFDYPGTGNQTLPQKINDHGVIAGIFIDPVTGASEGFFRSRSGRFSDPIIEPNDDSLITEVRGINNRRTICGDYDTSDGVAHGFFLSHTIFTGYDISSVFTLVLGINNPGDFSGTFIDDADGLQKGFVSIGGTVTGFSVPDAAATLAYQINTSNEVTGYYIANSDSLTHGYLRDSSGNLTFPIDPAGSTGTILFGNNDSNWVVGRYADASGITHGLFFMTPGDVLTFDFPGAAGFTSLNGINQQGYICGRYADAAGIAHGFLAKVNPNGTAQPNRNNLPLVPVKPAHPALETLRPGAPAL